jgi:hypothetical protein
VSLGNAIQETAKPASDCDLNLLKLPIETLLINKNDKNTGKHPPVFQGIFTSCAAPVVGCGAGRVSGRFVGVWLVAQGGRYCGQSAGVGGLAED